MSNYLWRFYDAERTLICGYEVTGQPVDNVEVFATPPPRKDPAPRTPEEQAAYEDMLAEAKFRNRVLKAVKVIVREIEYLRPADKPRQTAFQALIDKLKELGSRPKTPAGFQVTLR